MSFFRTCCVLWLTASPCWVLAGDPTLDRLFEQMVSADAKIRGRAKEQIRDICLGHEDLLSPYCQSEDEGVRLAALDVAGLLPASPSLLGILDKALGDKDPVVQRIAAASLGRLGSPEAHAKLAEGLSLPEAGPETRVVILDALGESGDAATANAIEAQLTHGDPRVRYSSARALYLLGQGETEKLKDRAEKESVGPVKAWILASLVVQKAGGGEGLLEYVTSSDALLRNLVVEAHVKARDPSAVPAWFAALKNPVWQVRFDSARGLSLLARPEDIPQLIEALSDSSPEVRAEVDAALRRLSNMDFGFQGSATLEARREAVDRWKAWWRDNAYRFDLKSQ
ncbi:MAG: HEAT repeat domain-containing protein [Planctomycetota bacterium]